MKKKHESLYWEFYERGFDQAVRMGDWKAIKLSLKGSKTEPYNLTIFAIASCVLSFLN